VDPILSASYPRSTLKWRKAMRALDGSEINRQLLPLWVENLVLKGTCPPWPEGHQRSKSFTISPAESMPSCMQCWQQPQRLTAPVILEIRKVASYIATQMRERNVVLVVPEVTFDEEENRRLAHIKADAGLHIGILHRGALLPSHLSLSTVDRYLDDGKTEDDLKLEYVIIDWADPPPLADVVPKEITVD
jgi:hypothetical protein